MNDALTSLKLENQYYRPFSPIGNFSDFSVLFCDIVCFNTCSMVYYYYKNRLIVFKTGIEAK